MTSRIQYWITPSHDKNNKGPKLTLRALLGIVSSIRIERAETAGQMSSVDEIRRQKAWAKHPMMIVLEPSIFFSTCRKRTDTLSTKKKEIAQKNISSYCTSCTYKTIILIGNDQQRQLNTNIPLLKECFRCIFF